MIRPKSYSNDGIISHHIYHVTDNNQFLWARRKSLEDGIAALKRVRKNNPKSTFQLVAVFISDPIIVEDDENVD